MSSPNWDSLNVQLASMVLDNKTSGDIAVVASTDGVRYTSIMRDDALNFAIDSILLSAIEAKNQDMIGMFGTQVSGTGTGIITINLTSSNAPFTVLDATYQSSLNSYIQNVPIRYSLPNTDFLSSIRGGDVLFIYQGLTGIWTASTVADATGTNTLSVRYATWAPMTNGATADMAFDVYSNLRTTILRGAQQYLTQMEANTI